MAYQEKFNYPIVGREYTSDSGRVYYIEHDGKRYDGVYSVTTIISKVSETKKAIEVWQNKIGIDNAKKITQKSLNFGTPMHDMIYHILTDQEYKTKFKPNYVNDIAERMAFKVIGELAEGINEIWGCEVPLFYPDLYAGRTDCVGVYNGVPSIIDFKNSYKDKKEEYMQDYFTQAAAYAMAHDYLFGTNIKQCVIIVSNSSNITAKKIIKSGDEFQQYKDRWTDMLTKFIS